MVRLLLEKGAELEAKTNYGWTALHAAAQQGRTAVVRLLLEKGAELEAKNNYDWTALHEAAWLGHTAAVRLLLEKGAAKDDRCRKALYWAKENEHTEVVTLLREASAEIELHSVDGEEESEFIDEKERSEISDE